jgi:hypothetical protein
MPQMAWVFRLLGVGPAAVARLEPFAKAGAVPQREHPGFASLNTGLRRSHYAVRTRSRNVSQSSIAPATATTGNITMLTRYQP